MRPRPRVPAGRDAATADPARRVATVLARPKPVSIAELEHAAPLQRAAALNELQRGAGNAAVARLIARNGTDTATAEQAPAPGPAATPGQIAAQEAIAVATRAKLELLKPHMLSHSNPTARNTGAMCAPPGPKIKLESITKRADSTLEVQKLGAGFPPAVYAAFFTGPVHDNVRVHQRGMIGTLDDTTGTMYVRLHDDGGTARSLEEMTSTVVHEVSHFLVKKYGEHPGGANSFDRYRDEFRAYWIETDGSIASIKDPDKRAAAIKKHLVGDETSGGYPNLGPQYRAPAPNKFKTDVDNHKRPDGFNLTNSPQLDRLFELFQEQATGKATTNDLVVFIDQLATNERAEAKGSGLIRKKAQAMPAPDSSRVLKALDSPTVDEYVQKLNPTKSALVSEFYKAISMQEEKGIQAAYLALPDGDRKALYMNPAVLVFVERHILAPRERACTLAMVATTSSKQYDRMATLLDALKAANDANAVTPLTAVPDDVKAAMKMVAPNARLALYSWASDAVFTYVELLPTEVRKPIKQALRLEREL